MRGRRERSHAVENNRWETGPSKFNIHTTVFQPHWARWLCSGHFLQKSRQCPCAFTCMLYFWKELATFCLHSLRCLPQALSSGNFLFWTHFLSCVNSIIAFVTLYFNYLFISSSSHWKFLFFFVSLFVFQCCIYWVPSISFPTRHWK